MADSQQKLAELGFFKASNPMWVYDQETFAFLEVNEAAIRHYGYSRREFLCMTILDIRPLEEIPKLLKEALRPDVRHESHRERWRHTKRDGSVIEVEVSSRELVFRGRRAELVSIKDVTATQGRPEEQRARREPGRIGQRQRGQTLVRIGLSPEKVVVRAQAIVAAGVTSVI